MTAMKYTGKLKLKLSVPVLIPFELLSVLRSSPFFTWNNLDYRPPPSSPELILETSLFWTPTPLDISLTTLRCGIVSSNTHCSPFLVLSLEPCLIDYDHWNIFSFSKVMFHWNINCTSLSDSVRTNYFVRNFHKSKSCLKSAHLDFLFPLSPLSWKQ